MKMSDTKKSIFTALLVALGIVLPLTLHAIPNAGNVLLPMHIPVLLCGLVCGFPYGLVCGIITPVLSHLLTGMPPSVFLLPMIAELAVYGVAASLFVRLVRTPNAYANISIALAGSMLSGRIIYGLLNALIFSAGNYSIQIWAVSAFVTALPGLAVQILLIPALIFALQKARLIPAP